MNKKKSWRWFIAGLLLAIFILIFILFRQAGNYLVKTDHLQTSDAIVILMGSTVDRVLEANDVYKAGMAEKILIVNNIQVGREELAAKGIFVPTQAQLAIKALSQMHIPDSLMFILPGSTTSTRDEADSLANAIARNEFDIKSVILVSSSAHMRRSSMIFKNSFKKRNLDIKVLCAPSKYSDFHPEQWWKHRENAKDVFLEYTKIIFFLLFEQW
ncbi:MAG: YdcF family protein [Bacteroidales bacterium]